MGRRSDRHASPVRATTLRCNCSMNRRNSARMRRVARRAEPSALMRNAAVFVGIRGGLTTATRSARWPNSTSANVVRIVLESSEAIGSRDDFVTDDATETIEQTQRRPCAFQSMSCLAASMSEKGHLPIPSGLSRRSHHVTTRSGNGRATSSAAPRAQSGARHGLGTLAVAEGRHVMALRAIRRSLSVAPSNLG